MVTYSKAEVKELGLESGICAFHERNPDQQATMESCDDCVYVMDACGCDEDSGCEYCDPPYSKQEGEVEVRS